MLRSRNRPRLRLYIDQGELLIEANSALPSEQHGAPSASVALGAWLQRQEGDIAGARLEAELAGAFTRLFCLPFSPSMNNPANILSMAEAYARNALGTAAPVRYQIAEPQLYQHPPLIIGITEQARDLFTLSKPGLVMQPYALAVWNRNMDKLPERNCWLAVMEPAYITLFYQSQGEILEVLGRQLSASSITPLTLLMSLLAQQFHRPSTECFMVDEFELLEDLELPPLLKLLLPANTTFKRQTAMQVPS